MYKIMTPFEIQKNEILSQIISSEAFSPDEKKHIIDLLAGQTTSEKIEQAMELIDKKTDEVMNSLQITPDENEAKEIMEKYSMDTKHIEHETDHEQAVVEDMYNQIEESVDKFAA